MSGYFNQPQCVTEKFLLRPQFPNWGLSLFEGSNKQNVIKGPGVSLRPDAALKAKSTLVFL